MAEPIIDLEGIPQAPAGPAPAGTDPGRRHQGRPHVHQLLPCDGHTEELIIDFGLNPQPFGVPTAPIAITQRIVTNFFTAKRMLQALVMTIQRHEATFGVIEPTSTSSSSIDHATGAAISDRSCHRRDRHGFRNPFFSSRHQ